MTSEEAYKTLKENLCAMCAYGSQNMESCDIRSCDNRDAIKALEQEPKSEWTHDHEILKAYADGANNVLEKISAEIQSLRNCSCSCSDGIIDDVEDIIDKYKGESENKK